MKYKKLNNMNLYVIIYKKKKKGIPMIKRTEYIDYLSKFRDKDVIKVITGIRRSGKSILMKQFQEELVKSNISKNNIISMNFESLQYEAIKDYKDLYDYIVSKCINKDKYYLLLDEIQKVKQWEKAIASFRVDINCDIYITGSNAYLLSSEIATLLSGRSVEIHVFPLSFSEYLEVNKELEPTETFDKYIKYGGFPGLIEMDHDINLCSDYLEGIYNTVVVKDILTRTKITNMDLLTRLMLFLTENIGNLVSANKIANYMKSNGLNTHPATIIEYIEAFEKAFILHKAKRFDIKGKKILRSPDKYYISDVGLRGYLHGFKVMDIGRVLENIIYIELLRRNYTVLVGADNKFEIDFIAKNNEGTQYFQVSLSIVDPKVKERELAGFRQISDQHRKTLLTMDYGNIITEDGINIKNIIDWLME